MSHALRGIKSTDPKKCRKYVTEVTNYLLDHRVFERATQLDLQSDIRGFNSEIGWMKRLIETCSEQTYMPNDSRNAEIDQRGHPNYTKPR
jgi:hypothetical protein